MKRLLEEEQEQKRDEYVAQELGISVDVLQEHDFEIEEDFTIWRVKWRGTPPLGVEVHGAEGTQWSNIAPFYEPDPEDSME